VIRINLLIVVPRAVVRRVWVPPEQRAAMAGLGLLLVTALALGGWWWALRREVTAVDRALAAAQADLTRLSATAKLVEGATARKAVLLERTNLIDRLRRGEREPVELLEVVSRSLPDGLWLIDLKQEDDTVQLEGRATSLTAVTDFVGRLQTSGRFQRPMDIVTAVTETYQDTPVVRFVIKGTAIRGAIAAGRPAGE
jgi:type IV pilus assembly protein PilN